MAAMRSRLLPLCCAIVMLARGGTFAQTGGPSHQRALSAGNDSDQTLEIPPRALAPPQGSAPADENGAEPGSESDDAPPVPTSGAPAAETVTDDDAANPKRPYLGISVQFVESHSTPGRDVEGLEVVGVDPGSPAERAGLHGRGAMTKLGATGATAGALMAPLDLVVMPLLKKSGQLGQGGDLIVAIDDKRVESETDLRAALDSAKPGDTIYLTVVRPERNGSHRTLKIPVRLASPDTSASGRDAPPVSPNMVPAQARTR